MSIDDIGLLNAVPLLRANLRKMYDHFSSKCKARGSGTKLRLADDVNCPHDWLVRMSYVGKIDCHKQFGLALVCFRAFILPLIVMINRGHWL